MTPEAFLHAFDVDRGDPYDEKKIRSRFRALWRLGLFEDITVEVETGPQGGSVLIVKVKERPTLTSVTYEDNKAVTRTQIEDRLKEREQTLKLGKPLDMRDVFFSESTIRELLAERGFLDASVEAEVRKVTETTRAVHFKILAGGKTRVRKIVFVGNEVFSSRKLKGALELTQARKWYWPWSGKNLYHPVKWEQDVSNIRDLYQNQGYLDVKIRPPVVEVVSDKKKGDEAGDDDDPQAADEPPGPEPEPEAEPAEDLTPKELERLAKKQRKEEEKARKQARKAEKKAADQGKAWVRLTVTVDEGPQYTLGELTLTGNNVFPDQVLRPRIPLREGDILRNNYLDFAVEGISRMYENRGHLYATVVRRIQRREEGNIADVEIVVQEDDPYYVSRVQFGGNSQTQDRVLRREMLTIEGELFSRDKLDVSKAKVNQLGYFHVPGEPVIEPIENESRVRVSMNGEERGRNEIQVGGGYSGFDGAFFNGVYSTRNFLGRGQTLSLALQVGGRSNRYQLSFQEPWFMNRPILMGFSVFRRDVDFGSSLNSESTGFGVIAGKRIGRFARFNLGYNFEEVVSTTRLTSVSIDQDFTTFTTEQQVSSLTPVYTYSTVNNPYQPNSGRNLTISMQIAGGPLGGDVSYLKPILRYTAYRQAWRKNYFALHAQLGMVTDWAGGSDLLSNNIIEEVPRYQRFWIGGDTLGPRVFETRTITPRRFVIIDEQGEIVDIIRDPRGASVEDIVTSGGQAVLVEVGGDRYWLWQNELTMPLNEQAEVAFFLDAGDSLFDDQSFSFETTRVSAGVELRLHLPIFPVPLRLIYGFPLRKVEFDRTSSFTFSIGRSF
jgi:outer membrane protein insertion porin family